MKNLTADNRQNTRSMVQTAIFGAIIIIMAFTPFLGYIPLGFTRATIIHIPVILASLLLGPKKGAALGFLFGLTSFINNTTNPTITSFVFTPFYHLGEFEGGFGSIMLSSQNFSRRSSILYLQADKENRQKIGIPMGTDYCRSYRLIGKYTFGYELDFSVFQESLCSSQWSYGKSGLRIYFIHYRNKRRAGSHCGRRSGFLYRKDFNEKKHQRKIRVYQ